ncbi:cation transporter, partial [Ectopseudomonas toyotomiensis]|uniref:cation transporter n=1 Tax=Ectopseudomonas toyotomiensis TaxID=554344 RepID=UPI003D10F46E
MSRCCDHSHQQPPAHPEHAHDHTGHNHEAVPQPADAALTGACNTRIRIEQMDCPTEERLIRDALGRLPGVAGLHFNLLQRVLTVSHDEGMLAQVLPAIRALGFTPQVEDDRTAQQPAPPVRRSVPGHTGCRHTAAA